MNWQPIETFNICNFDKESWFIGGPMVLLADGSSAAFIGSYGYTKLGKGRWRDSFGRVCNPTHWMPLPKPPQ